MKLRSAALQGGVAAVALVAAYLTWTRPPAGAPGDVTIVELSAKELQRIRFEEGARKAIVERSGDDVWVTIATPKPAPKPATPREPKPEPADAAKPQKGPSLASPSDAGTPSTTAAETPAPVIEQKTFRGNDSAERLFERLAPLRATRALGKLDDKTLEEVGLAKTERRLVLEGEGRTHTFGVNASGKAFGGTYVQDERGEVYLLASGPVSELDAASSRLVDRRLHGWPSTEQPDAFTLRRGGNSREFVAVPSSQATRAGKWAPKQTPESPDELVSNWHERINRLGVLEVLGRGEPPSAGDPQVDLRVDYARKGKPAGWLEVGKAGNEWFARTEHTAGWVRLTANTGALVQEAEKIASAQ